MLLRQKQEQQEIPKRINSFRVQLVPLRPTPKYKIHEPLDVLDVVSEMEDYDRESAKILSLDTKNQVMGIETISIGSLNAAIVHPRESVKGAILNNSNSVIFVHNHPSGICTPSTEDIQVNKKLTDAFDLVGIPLLDSIIIGKGCYYSFKAGGGASELRKPSVVKENGFGFKANPGLVDTKVAFEAHRGTSFEPEKRGEQEIQGFVNDVQSIYEELKPYAKSESQKSILISEINTFQIAYAKKYNELLYTRSRIVSPIIAGPSKFPAERMRKLNDAYDIKVKETIEWRDRAKAAILRELKGKATEEAGGEIEVIKKKISDLERLQQMMKDANVILRKNITDSNKITLLIQHGWKDENAKEIIKPDYLGRTGFTYQLTNNSSEIRRLKLRVIELEKKEATETSEIAFEGGHIVDNRELDRVQIFFHQKPPQEIIDKLRSEGWMWSPSNIAWQRKRTNAAMYSATKITGATLPLKKEHIPEQENLIKSIDDIESIKKETPEYLPPIALAPSPQPPSLKQQLIARIQSARTLQELLPIQSEISFGALNSEERRQLHDIYQKRLASLKEEIPFGVPIRTEAGKPRVLGAPLRKEIGVKRERVGIGQVPLTGGVSTSTRLGRFDPGVIEKERAEIEARKRIEKAGLPYSIHPLIKRLAESPNTILMLGTKRGKETVDDIVLSRYSNYCPPGTIVDKKNVQKATERWIVYPQKLKSCMGELERRLAEAMMIRERRTMYARM